MDSDAEHTTDETPSPLAVSPLPGITSKKVLCWVNSVDERDEVVRVARALAVQAAGTCHVLMCLDIPKLNATAGPGRAMPAPLTPEVIRCAKQRLANLYDDVHTMVLPGRPVSEIRRYARNHKMDLVVLGAQGLDAERACGERLTDDAPCTVMILVFSKGE